MVLTAASQLCPETSSTQTSLEKNNKCSINYKETWSPNPSEQEIFGTKRFDKSRVSQGIQSSVDVRLLSKPRSLGFQGVSTPQIPQLDKTRLVGKGQEKLTKLEVKGLFQSSNPTFKEQRQPRPPRLPRSHSTNDFKQTLRKDGHLKAGRQIWHRSYSSPNISSTNSIKLPNPTQDLLFSANKTKDNKIAKKKDERQRNTVKELPSVAAGKTKGHPSWKIPFSASKMVKQLHQTFAASKSASERNKSSEDEQMMEEIRSQTKESERDKEDEWDWKKLSSTNRHVVFVINHDEGRLETLGTLQPVPEEPEHEPRTCIKSPWHYYDNQRDNHVVEELFESDDEGLVMNNDKGLDPIKKAMINNWIMDVTLKTSEADETNL